MINVVACLLALTIGLIVGYFVALIGVAVGAASEKTKMEGKHE